MADAAAERRTETVPEWKREEVAAIADLLSRYDSVGIVDVTGIPSRQLQAMRRDLHGTAELRMGRNTLVRRALEDEGVEQLSEYVSGQVGVVGTDDNPFTLYQRLEESKTPAPIGAGEVAPNDIVIEAGDTGMDPGPFVGELQTVGAAARIDEGSIMVTEDSTVLEAGEEVSADLANVLNELGMEPKEVGLDLRAVFSEGVLFEADELEIDVDAYRADVERATARGRALSVEAGFPTRRTAPAMLSKARGQAVALALSAGVESPDAMPDLVARADAQVRALAARIDDEEALPDELHDVSEPARASGDGGADGDSGAGDGNDEQTDDQPEAEPDDGDDDDDDAAGEGLGEMFG